MKNPDPDKKANWFSEQYIIVNAVFAGVILLVMGYSIIFSPETNNYPVVCIHEKVTGLPCPSCGLSHSFSYILSGKLDEAYEWNSYGLRIFIFFFAQLLMRVVFSINYLKHPQIRKSLIVYDATVSVVLLLIGFYPFIRALIQGVYL